MELTHSITSIPHVRFIPMYEYSLLKITLKEISRFGMVCPQLSKDFTKWYTLAFQVELKG